MTGRTCGCDCISLFSPDEAPGFWDSGTHAASGEAYGVTLEATNAAATYNAKSSGVVQSLSCEINSLGGVVAKCSISRDNGAVSNAFSVAASTDTVSLSGQSRRVIRYANNFDLRLDACSVGPNLLLTASSENYFSANVSATPMQFDGRRGVYRDWESWASNPYTKTPPPGVTGYEASDYEIYCNGQKIAAFQSPSAGTLSAKPGVGAPCITISSNAGTPDDRITIERRDVESPALVELKAGGLPGGDTRFKAWEIDATSSVAGYVVWKEVKRWQGFESWGFKAGQVRHEQVYATKVNAGETITISATEAVFEDYYFGFMQDGQFQYTPVREEVRAEIPFLYVVPELRSHPFPTGVLEQCSQEGEYLVVGRQAGKNTLDMIGPRRSVFETFSDQTNSRTPQPLVSYGSFVVRKSKYAYAVTQFDDVFEDEFLNYRSTWFYRENPWAERIGVAGPEWIGPAGETVEASCYPDPPEDIAKYDSLVEEKAGNLPLHQGVNVQFKTFAVPPDGKRGARPRFVGSSDEVGTLSYEYEGVEYQYEYGRSDVSVWPIFKSAVTKLLVRFDKPVTGVTADMLSVEGRTPPDGTEASVSVISVRRVGDSLTDYRFVLAGSPQVPNSQWTATFTPAPAIGILPSSLQVRLFSGSQQEPGEPGVLYIDTGDGTDWVWDGIQYSRPGENDCEEFGTTVLACRFMWCVARNSHYAQDTATDPDRTMPSRASVSTQVATTKTHSGDISTSVTPANATVFSVAYNSPFTGEIGPSTKTIVLSDSDSCSFVPRLPPDQTTKTGTPFSYFGVPTTIHPAAPATISHCLAPREEQPHGSLIFGTGDEPGFAVTLPELIGINREGLFTAGKPTEDWLFFDFSGYQARPDKLRVSGTFSLLSDNQPQNFWASTKTAVFWQAIQRSLGAWGGIGGVTVRHDRVTVRHAIVRMAASRGRLTYRGLQTTTVTELVFTIAVEYFGKTDYRLRTGSRIEDFGPWQGSAEFTRVATATIIVPPHKEANLGQLEDLNGRTWNIVRS